MSFTVLVKCKNLACKHEFTVSLGGDVSPSDYCATTVCPVCKQLSLQIIGADFVK